MVTIEVHATFDFNYESKDIFTSLATSCSIFKPEACQSIGNMLLLVKPGIVLISFKNTLFEYLSKKKSTRAKPKIFKALQLRIVISLICLEISGLISAGIIILLLFAEYFDL